MPPPGVPPYVAPRLVATVGNANDPGTYSGIPFHFLQAGRRAGLVDTGLDLAVDRPVIKARRVIWNLIRLGSGRGKGGFQYSDTFLEAMWRGYRRPATGSIVLNCFQLYPSSLVAEPSIDKWFFIDQTLKQLFDYYEESKLVGAKIAAEAMAREAVGYGSATGIIVYSRWAKESVVNDYGIPADKVRVVLLGPSLDPDKLARHTVRPAVPAPGGPLKLIFVGKEWRRKGLDRLLRAMVIARRMGSDIRLQVIGCARSTLPEPLGAIEGIDWLGFIDKRKEEDRFISLLSEAHVGCSLSLYEAGGINLREYHALGLPVIGPDTGGAPEHMIPEASIAIGPDASDDEVAEVLFELWRDRDGLAAMNEAAWQGRASVSWAASIESLASFWPYSNE